MIKFIKNSILFLVFLLPIYVVLVIGYGLIMPDSFKKNLNYKLGSYGYTYTRLKEVKEKVNIDILILGSSHAYRGYDTSFFEYQGYKVMNLGTSAQTPLQTKLLMDRYLDGLNPKLVIYDVYPDSFSSDGLESGLDIISNDYNGFGSFKMVCKINHVKSYNLFFYASFRDLIKINSNFEEKKSKNDKYVKGGYVEKNQSFFNLKKFKSNQKHLVWNQKQLVAFEHIVSKIKEKKIEFMLVQAPVTSVFYENQKDNEVFDSKMKFYEPSYMNFNISNDLNDTLDFYDAHHLNKNGIKKFNNKILPLVLNKLKKK